MESPFPVPIRVEGVHSAHKHYSDKYPIVTVLFVRSEE